MSRTDEGLAVFASPGQARPLFDRSGRDFLGLSFRCAPLLVTLLDVLILALPFRDPGTLRHRDLLLAR